MSLFIFLILIGITSVNAKEIVTETLDLTNHDTEDQLDTKGWSWNNETKTLKLEDANIETSEFSPCIDLPGGNVTIEFEGNNTLKAQKSTTLLSNNKTNLTIQSSNNGVLNLEITEPGTNTETDGNVNNGATILTPYNLDIKSGTINSRGNFLADGVVTISGGNVNINTKDMVFESDGYEVEGIYSLRQVNITGGNVDIRAKSAAIVVDGIMNATDYQDGVIIGGGNVSLITQSPRLPAVYVGNRQTKNIIIDGGNITLGGYYGLYTADGVIKVNHFDSFNADNVSSDVFRIGDKEGNAIIIKNADYSKVDEAIAKANSLNKDDYKDFSDVEAALNAVIRDKNILEQEQVDAMAEAIINAINALELKNIPTQNPDTSDSILSYGLFFILSVASIIFLSILVKRNIIN